MAPKYQAIETYGETFNAEEPIEYPFECKSAELVKQEDGDVGAFEGFGAVFGNKDLGMDIIERGAFTKSLKNSRTVLMLWSHHSGEPPIGEWKEFEETDKGLRVKGEIFLDDERGRIIFKNMRKKQLTGLSIGFGIPKGGSIFEDDGTRIISKIDLFEISPVNFPMNERARIGRVKSAVLFQDLPLADMGTKWDRKNARARVQEWASSHDVFKRYQKAFATYDRATPSVDGCKLQLADVIDDELTIVPSAVFAAGAKLMGITGHDIPEAERFGVRRHLERYYIKMSEEFDDESIEAPWIKAKRDPVEAFADVRRATFDLLETPRDYEAHLRDEGASNAAAKAICIGGFKAKPEPRDEDGDRSWIAKQLAKRTEIINPPPSKRGN